MAPITPQKRVRLSPVPITPVKRTRVTKESSDSDEDDSPSLSSNESVGLTPRQPRQYMPPPLTPKKSLDGLSRFGGLQLATPGSSRSGQRSPGIQAGYAALEIDEELDMEQGDAGKTDTEDEEQEVANAVCMESDMELQDAMKAIGAYIYPPPLRNFKNSMAQYGPEQDIMEGETPQDDDEGTDKPVRILNNFVFHLDRTKQLWGLGDVCPKLDEDVNDEMESDTNAGEDTAQIHLGPVVDAYQGYGDTYTNASIWVETELAWYILEAPHQVYQNAYKPFLVAHTFKLILSLLVKDSPMAGAEKFNSTIQEPHGIYSVILRNAGQHLGFRLGLVDFWSNIVGIRSACMNADDQGFLETPMVSQLLGHIQPHKHPTISNRQGPPISSEKYTHQNSVTPLIHQIANRHFLRPLKCLGQPLEEYEEYEGTQKLIEEMIQRHEEAPCQLDLSRSDMVEGRDGAETFTNIEIDGTQYQVWALMLQG
ncbi:hypothetical protein FRC04_003587 [Tulasnella sp. 424]|nr:hypothetical protein FRC04_003587 [Tulasnella sp. 424]